ncbi:MAG: ferrous iron transport protein B [candidate division Zixibacteria bacterium]|nr:ferrous iron transport protein B [candidate division Zixibacteria bacterium]
MAIRVGSPGTRKKTVTVAICGNPNCGKTTIFNAITGLRQRVANYPGVTVEKTIGTFAVAEFDQYQFNLLDIPGTYSLAANSPDEYIAARALFGRIEGESRPDVVVCVIDATNLERSLYLAFQVMQTGASTVVALNMMDLLAQAGREIDLEKLSRELGGVPVIPVTASKGRGITELKRALADAVYPPPRPPMDFYDRRLIAETEALAACDGIVGYSTAELVRVLLDEHGPAERDFLAEYRESKSQALDTARRALRNAFGMLANAEAAMLTHRATEVAARVTKDHGRPTRSFTDRIDRAVLHPVGGLLILAILMILMFQSIFAWAAPLMNAVDELFQSLAGFVAPLMSDGPLQSLLIDGVIGGVGSVLVFLPQIVILFVFIAVIEDSGYMPRAAFLVDRAFGWCGLSGKSFIPMLSSFACAVPGIMATRTIEDRRQRLLTIIVAPLMSCSARLPVYTIMIAAFVPATKVLGLFNVQGLVLGSLYLLGIVTAVLVALVTRLFSRRQQHGSFLMEMPSYKMPTLKSVFIRVYTRAKSFVIRAGTVIFALTIVIWALSYYPHSDEIRDRFTVERAQIENRFSGMETNTSDKAAALTQLERDQAGAYLRDSYFGRFGRLLEPAFEPLGWDWKITMAALASFPAREVVISTLGTIYNLGSGDVEEASLLTDKMRRSNWETGPRAGTPVFSVAVALSIMVFFALCCQCGATLITIRQETNGLRYPIIVFIYMTSLAYGGAWAVYQITSRLVGL